MSALARWRFRHRLVVVGSWVALLVALKTTLLSATVGTSYSDAFNLPGTESAKAQALLQTAAPAQAGDSDQIVVHVRDGSIGDATVRAKITPMLAKVAALPSVVSVRSMYGPSGVLQVSKDGRTAYATVTFDATADRLPIPDITRVIDTAHAARDDQLQVELGGEAISDAAEGAIQGTEAVGIVAAGIVLFVAFGSLLGMLVPPTITARSRRPTSGSGSATPRSRRRATGSTRHRRHDRSTPGRGPLDDAAEQLAQLVQPVRLPQDFHQNRP